MSSRVSLLRPEDPQAADNWMQAPVSSCSRFGDHVWQLDIHRAGTKPGHKRLSWRKRLPDGSCLTDPRNSKLLRAAKQFLWSMAVDPPRGQKRSSPSTLLYDGTVVRTTIGWMISDGLTSFGALDPAAIERLCAWLRTRPGKRPGGILAPNTVRNYLGVIANMYRQRDKLEDAPRTNPLTCESAGVIAGASRDSVGSLPYIPDALAVDLLCKALAWVETHAEGILRASELCRQVTHDLLAAGARTNNIGKKIREVMGRAAIPGPDGRPLVQGRGISRIRARLVDACFILIAGFVGMRVSEILSMRIGAVERHPLGETGLDQAYVVARLFKTVDDPEGRVERWLAPEPVVRAVECLERLGTPLRAAFGHPELFLNEVGFEYMVSPISGFTINRRLNLFAAHVGVPLHKGKPWVFSAHQFRKTFARFVARGDRSQLLALADHYKHVSVSMTSRGYVGNDFDLHELVDEESRAETAIALDRLLSGDRLGGRMGERIVARNHAFRGRAGEQVRRDYVAFILAETDLRIRGCDYGWCVFQAETALCGGEVAPNEAGRGPSVCAKCANLAVDDRHVPYWQDRRRRNQALSEQAASPLVRAVLAETSEECGRVLKRIEEDRSGCRAKPNTPAPDDGTR